MSTLKCWVDVMKFVIGDAGAAAGAIRFGDLAGSGRKAIWSPTNKSGSSRQFDPFVNAGSLLVACPLKGSRPCPAGAAGRHGTRQPDEPLGARQIRRIVNLAVNPARAGGTMAPATGRPPGLRNLRGVVGTPGIECQLGNEVRKSLERRFLKRVFREGDPGCPQPAMPAEAFLLVVRSCNGVMEDLHRRFPKLAECVPPNLAQTDLLRETGYLFGGYDPGTRTLCFANPMEHDLDRIWDDARARGQVSPQARGLDGLIMHEYAHHLCLGLSCEPHEWITSLVTTLQSRGMLPEHTNVSRWDPASGDFGDEVSDSVQSMGFGVNAADNAAEFAAEALSWRMAPGYGESSEIPRMPEYLEKWLHESFPLTPGQNRP
ncbi:MAG: hypothetical protein OXP09_05105 [Gammaproteobacteria bacterium]|nr:hypothetical protein [Gammaproteobacteria bacterium]MDE0364934.1 hypothetical protein [Gammaproteobacteria bacterium]